MSASKLLLAKLQYEILQVPLEDLAKELGVPCDLLEDEARINNWQVLWPEQVSEDGSADDDIDSYIEDRQKKLVAFNLAKEILLSQKYLELESSIIKKAIDLTDAIDVPYDLINVGAVAKAIKDLSGLYKDMAKNKKSTELSLGLDSQGLPTAIIRDLSGQ